MENKKQKLSQRVTHSNGHLIGVGLIGDCGYLSIEDNNLYPDGDSRSNRRDLNFNRIMLPLMTREELKELKKAIGDVLKNSK